MSNVPVKHHVVPRAYLKGFTDPAEPELIYVFRPGAQPFRTGVKGVAFVNHFYTYEDNAGNKHSIERALADKIEGPTGPVLAKIRALQPITPQEKEVLARYISVMLTRVPKHRKRAESWLPEVVEQFRERLDEELDGLLTNSPPQLETREQLLEMGHRYLDRYKVQPPSHLAVGIVSDKYAPIFAQMKWVFYTTGTQLGFVTSDNPVFFFEGFGLVGKNGPSEMVEVSFPISTQVALWASWRGIKGLPDMGYARATEPLVEEINTRTVSGALRDVYYHSNPRWLRGLVNKDKASLKLKRIV
jgi:hypothetical protein